MPSTPKQPRSRKNANTSEAKASLAARVQQRFKGCPRHAKLEVEWYDKRRDHFVTASVSVREVLSLAGVALNDAPDKVVGRSRKTAKR